MENKTIYETDSSVTEAEGTFQGSKSLKELVLEYMQKEQETREKHTGE